jgi:membrane associated rhomboid family serine protease
MIPIRDTIPSRKYPVVTYGIITLNVFVYFIQTGLGPGLNRFVYFYGLVPARYSVDQIAAHFSTGQQLFSLVSFMFLHGGFFHLLGNMWSLYIFGDNVEDRLGSLRYLFFYLLCGLASGISHLLINYHSNVPTIGASGAIAGVMGAYFIAFPGSKVLTLIPILIIPYFIEVPAYLFLGIWFLFQFLSAAGSQGTGGGIAWWAHIGGFVFGMLFLKLFDALPLTGISTIVDRVTEKKTGHRLQMVQPTGTGEDPNLYGTMKITPFEALVGTRKLVNVPWGFQKRIFKVSVPADTRHGGRLRLKGMGKQMPDGTRGDLLLTVEIES